MTANHKWVFKPVHTSVKTITTSVATLGAFGVGLSFVFPWPVLAAAGAYAAYHAASTIALYTIPAFKRHYFKGQLTSGAFAPMNQAHPFAQAGNELSDRLGRKQRPDYFEANQKFVAKVSVNFGLRTIFKPLIKKAMPTLFAALSNANAMLSTKEALAGNYTPAELKYIAAHEMSHLQADQISMRATARTIIKKTAKFLFWGGMAAAGLVAAGVTLPFTATVGGLSLATAAIAAVGIKEVAMLGINYATRVMEYRADRNAMYLTRDYNSAVSALSKIDPIKSEKRQNLLSESLLTHPSYKRRLDALKASWEKALTYPEVLPGSNALGQKQLAEMNAPQSQSWSEKFGA